MNLSELTKAIEKISTVNGADIRAVLYALVDVAADNLANGTIVRLGDLGSIRITLSSDGRNTAEEVNATAIRSTGVIFTPGEKIREMFNNAKFQKVYEDLKCFVAVFIRSAAARVACRHPVENGTDFFSCPPACKNPLLCQFFFHSRGFVFPAQENFFLPQRIFFLPQGNHTVANGVKKTGQR